jgi:hypothetical protein
MIMIMIGPIILCTAAALLYFIFWLMEPKYEYEEPQIEEAIELSKPQEKTKIKDFETMLLEYESETETVTWEVTKNKS